MKTRETGEAMAVLLPDHAQTKIPVTRDGSKILHAVMGPPSRMRLQAAVRLLAGLALWFQRTARVVLCVSGRCDGSDPSLTDAFEVGTTRLRHVLESVPMRSERRRAIGWGGQGDFGDLCVAMRRALGAS